MIARAGSGHIGTSFSASTSSSWLHLDELRRTRRSSPDLATSSSPRRATTCRPSTRCSSGSACCPSTCSTAAPARRPAGPSRRRDAVHRGQHRLARHGHLEGEGHGARQSAEPAGSPNLRADRRRRAAGRPDLGVARVGRQRAARARSSSSSTTTRSSPTRWVAQVSDLGDLEAKFARSAGTCARCDGHDVAGARPGARRSFAAIDRPPEGASSPTRSRARASRSWSTLALPATRLYRFH